MRDSVRKKKHKNPEDISLKMGHIDDDTYK